MSNYKHITGTYNRSYGFFWLILANVKENLLKLFKQKRIVPSFPARVGNYTFKENVKKEGLRKSYQIGLYQTSSGKKAIGKMIGKNIKGYHYYSLINEIVTYKTLYNVRERVKSKLPKDIAHVIIPKVLSVIETNDYLLELIEFVDGIPAERKSHQEKLKVYFAIREFMCFLGKNMLPEEKRHISQRTKYNYILLYPFLVVKAMLTYPSATKQILKGIPVFLSALPKFGKTSWNNLSHRDLHFLNILVSKKQIALIDLQQCVFTNSFYDYVTTLKEVWQLDEFYKIILKEVYKRFSKENDFLPLFRAFSVNVVTHGLTGSGFKPKTISKWVNFLSFAASTKSINYHEK